MNVGVLAFQGDFAEHVAVLKVLKIDHCEVRSVDDLRACTHLIIPGGESTVMSRFLKMTNVGEEIQKRVSDGSLAVYGTCAGAILLAKNVTGKNTPETLGLIDITIERNAYGSQIQSFDTSLTIKGIDGAVQAAFIRAPIITKIGKDVEVLSTYEDKPVLVRQGNIWAGTFHPEARDEKQIHELFLTK